MRKYFWPIFGAVLVNIIVLLGLLYANFYKPKSVMLPSPSNPLVINKILANNPNEQNTAASDRAWLLKHYGDAININKSFSAGKNLAGYIVNLKSNPDVNSIIYSVNNGEYYFMGSVIDNRGANISATNAARYISSAEEQAIYDDAQKLPGIVEGNPSAPQAIVVIDPNSNVFPILWRTFLTDTKENVFSIRWVLLNYIKPMGPNIAANILQAKDKLAALAYNAEHYNATTQTGGYPAATAISPEVLDRLRANWSFVQRHNLYQLPVTIAKGGDKYYVFQGTIMDETLEAIFNDG
jgi:hypothetical protein